MRLFNLDGRLSTFVGGAVVDVATASDNRFSSDPQHMFDDWGSLVEWGRSVDASGSGAVDVQQLQAPVPRPPQVFAIGLNYKAHAQEGIFSVPEEPTVFTKWPTCIVGPSHRGRATGRHRLGDRARRRDLAARPQGQRGRCHVVRGRLHGWPGPVGSRLAAQGPCAAMEPRQVALRIRAYRSVAGHPRRVLRPARSGNPQLARRRDAADVAHVDADLRHPYHHRVHLGRLPATTG